MAAVPPLTAVPWLSSTARDLSGAIEAGAVEAAPLLLGLLLTRASMAARIVEVEAYREDDPASHSRRGPTPRTAPMFGPPGCWYVYFSYGMHWCANLTCGPVGRGEAVLLRAALPETGLDELRRRRGEAGRRVASSRLLDGPAKLAQGFGLTGTDSGQPAFGPAVADGVRLIDDGIRLPVVRTTARVGISSGIDRPWRFCAAGAPMRTPGERPVPRLTRGAR